MAPKRSGSNVSSTAADGGGGGGTMFHHKLPHQIKLNYFKQDLLSGEEEVVCHDMIKCCSRMELYGHGGGGGGGSKKQQDTPTTSSSTWNQQITSQVNGYVQGVAETALKDLSSPAEWEKVNTKVKELMSSTYSLAKRAMEENLELDLSKHTDFPAVGSSRLFPARGLMAHVWQNPKCARNFCTAWNRVWQAIFDHRILGISAPFSTMFCIQGTYVSITVLPPLLLNKHAPLMVPGTNHGSEGLLSYMACQLCRALYLPERDINIALMSGIDGRHYVMSLSEILTKDHRVPGFRSSFFRPELLRQYMFAKPEDRTASADANANEGDRKSKDSVIISVPEFMRRNVFPALIRQLIAAVDQRQNPEDRKPSAIVRDHVLRENFHKCGVNMCLMYHVYVGLLERRSQMQRSGSSAAEQEDGTGTKKKENLPQQDQQQPASTIDVLLAAFHAEMIGRVLKQFCRCDFARHNSEGKSTDADRLDVVNRIAMLSSGKDVSFWENHLLPGVRKKYGAPQTFQIHPADVNTSAALKVLTIKIGSEFSTTSSKFNKFVPVAGLWAVFLSLTAPFDQPVIKAQGFGAHIEELLSYAKMYPKYSVAHQTYLAKAWTYLSILSPSLSTSSSDKGDDQTDDNVSIDSIRKMLVQYWEEVEIDLGKSANDNLKEHGVDLQELSVRSPMNGGGEEGDDAEDKPTPRSSVIVEEEEDTDNGGGGGDLQAQDDVPASRTVIPELERVRFGNLVAEVLRGTTFVDQNRRVLDAYPSEIATESTTREQFIIGRLYLQLAMISYTSLTKIEEKQDEKQENSSLSGAKALSLEMHDSFLRGLQCLTKVKWADFHYNDYVEYALTTVENAIPNMNESQVSGVHEIARNIEGRYNDTNRKPLGMKYIQRVLKSMMFHPVAEGHLLTRQLAIHSVTSFKSVNGLDDPRTCLSWYYLALSSCAADHDPGAARERTKKENTDSKDNEDPVKQEQENEEEEVTDTETTFHQETTNKVLGLRKLLKERVYAADVDQHLAIAKAAPTVSLMIKCQRELDRRGDKESATWLEEYVQHFGDWFLSLLHVQRVGKGYLNRLQCYTWLRILMEEASRKNDPSYAIRIWYPRLERLFKKYDRARVAEIEFLLEQWRGREPQLLSNLIKEYGPEPASTEDVDAGEEAPTATMNPISTKGERKEHNGIATFADSSSGDLDIIMREVFKVCDEDGDGYVTSNACFTLIDEMKIMLPNELRQVFLEEGGKVRINYDQFKEMVMIGKAPQQPQPKQQQKGSKQTKAKK